MDKKTTILQYVKKHGFVTLEEAKKLNVSATMMSRYVAQGDLLRPERGIYTDNIDWLSDPLKKYLPVCNIIPEAVICGISALTYYELTDEEERNIWIALPHKTKTRHKHFKIIRLSENFYSLGIVRKFIWEREFRIYEIERTIVDAFKYLSEESAIKALKGYFKTKKYNLDKLLDYGKNLKKPLDEIIKVVMTD